MISKEPTLRVGIFEHAKEARGVFNGRYVLPGNVGLSGEFHAYPDRGALVLSDSHGKEIIRGKNIECSPASGSTFMLYGVTIGIQFHWERNEDQKFPGSLSLVLREDGTICSINSVALEQYLESVISSEMSAEAPMELLRAHAITSRSWLVAMLERERRDVGVPVQRTIRDGGELIRWYGREDHDIFDVCADDHCQRYQGITKIVSPTAAEAVRSTYGVFLVFGNSICDARFSKACGGLTDTFPSAWDDVEVPYLSSVSDSALAHEPIRTEDQAARWIFSRPDAHCNTTNGKILRQILPSFDQETTDFFRWRAEYGQEELASLIAAKSGIDFGTILNLVPVKRGPSGRIVKLRIEGTRNTLVVGKELEIRRWLSKSHLYSSAFIVEAVKDSSGMPVRFILHGGGWGHGIGLCQIGAGVMAAKGKKAEEIVKHYFRGAELVKVY
jgi:stage II sporulation protein D